jgi:4-phytase/acid phosphatase
MLKAMRQGPKLTVLAGHDTNIADLGGFLDLHWQVPSYPRDNAPPGGALGFEVLSAASGKQFVRAFYRAQTMDQVRELRPLSDANPASYEYLPIPGCASLCPLEEFDRMVHSKLVEPVQGKPAPDRHRGLAGTCFANGLTRPILALTCRRCREGGDPET